MSNAGVNMMIIKTALISFAVYFYVLLIVRLVGRKTMSQMTFFDFILGVTLENTESNNSGRLEESIQ